MKKPLKVRIPWNKGMRKPQPDDLGNLWCNCQNPKLTQNSEGKGQVLCCLCGYPWHQK